MSANIEKLQECGEFKVSGWHLKKEVTIGQLITILVILVSGLWWASSVETRLVRVSDEIIRVEQKQDLQMMSITRLFNRIDRKLNKIDDKMDRKADK